MKKLLFILLVSIGLTFGAKAQNTTYVQLGVSTGFNVLNGTVELGVESGKHRLAAVGQSFDKANQSRTYFVGGKYGRIFNDAIGDFNLVASLAAKVNVNYTEQVIVEPGLALEALFGRGVSLVTGLSAPVIHTSGNNDFTLGGNLGLRINL